MRISLDVRKTPEQNAAEYYEKAKKAKKKLEGARQALEASRRKLEALQKAKAAEQQKKKEAPKQEKKWYEKLRWFISSEGFLVIGGKDATSNEIVIKKHTEANDIVFHTDMAGSPFFVIKTEGKVPGEATMQETAQATASYSRAWRAGLGLLEVFHVAPEQVSKAARAGEYMGKGAFMIYGKTNYVSAELRLAVGVTDEGRVMGGPPQAVKAHCTKYAEVVPGRDRTSDAAKRILKRIGGDLDSIITALPAGGCSVRNK